MEYIILQLSYPWCSAKNGQEWKDHFKELKEIDGQHITKDNNYKVSFHVINAADYGIPQIRKRVFIIGFRKNLKVNMSFPEATHSKEAFLIKKLINNSYSKRNRKIKNMHMCDKKVWITVDEAIKDLPKIGSAAATAIQHIFLPGAKSYKGHTGSVLEWPAKSLKAGTHGVGGGENMLRYRDVKVRYFTIRECARLQTFPDSWMFKGPISSITRQLGNAVPVSLARMVAKSIEKALKDQNKSID
jgi:DNA (cytosine-5)-methyltransferase 1